MLFENFQHRLVGGLCLHPRLDDRGQLVAVLCAVAHRGEARVLGKLRTAHRKRHRRPLPLEHQDHDVALRSLEGAARTYQLMLRAHPFRHELAVGRGPHLNVCFVHVVERIDHRDVDVLPDARALAVEESAADGGEGVHAGGHVADAQPDEHRRPVRIARHVHQSREGLRDEVVADLVRERPGAPEGRDRRHDEARIELAERGVVEAALFHYSWTVIFDHHVCFFRQAAQKLDRFGLGEVQAEALLAAVLLDEVGAAPVAHRGQQPRRVAHRRLLDLDDFGAHLGHKAGYCRARQILREVQHAHAGQHMRDVLIVAFHRGSPAATLPASP